MRDLIKILIALAFIAGAFWVGKYMTDERCSTYVNELNLKSEMDKKLILSLHDSLKILTIELRNEKAKNNLDTLQAKQVVKKKKPTRQNKTPTKNPDKKHWTNDIN